MDKKRIIWVVVTVLIVCVVIAAIVGMAYIYNENDRREEEATEQIKAAAMRDLDIPADTESELTFTGYWEEIAWSEYNLYIYTLKVGEKLYLVGVQRKNWEVHDVDVECEIEAEALE